MKSRNIFIVLAFVTLLCSVRWARPEVVSPFVVEVIDYVEEVVLGLPIVCDVRVRNVSGEGQGVVAMELVQKFESWPNDVKERDLPGHSHWDSPSELPRVFYKPEDGFEVPPDWSQTKERVFRLPGPGRYSFRYVIRMGPTPVRVKKMFDAPEEHWIGEASSGLITVVVKEPEGLDAEALRAVCARAPQKLAQKIPPADCYRMSWFSREPTGTFQLLLTDYSESIYASYEIFKSHRNNWIWKLDFYEQPGNLSNIWGYTQCNSSAMPDRGMKESRKLIGKEYLRCQEQWLRIALENHPDTWFSDDIRLILAGDAYLLGDKERCRSLLEELIARGRPSVAGKARELLDGMIEKGMLPASTPKPGFAGGTAR